MALKYRVLTPTAVRQLKVGETIREHHIAVMKLEGDERWRVEFMFHGERVHRTVGRSSEGWTRSRCEAYIEARKAEILDGTPTLPKGRKTHLRFEELAVWYLEEMEKSGGKNLPRKRAHLEQRLLPALGRIAVDQLAETTLNRFAKSRSDEGAKAATINREFATLSHVLSVGVKGKKIARKPCSVPRLQEDIIPRQTLSDNELLALRRAAALDHDTRMPLFIEFALGTSMRQGEIGRARFSDIEWSTKRIFLPNAKAGPRYQPLSERLVRDLATERAKRPAEGRDGWIFPARTQEGHLKQFNQPYRRVVIAAGLCPTRVTPHLFRHTALTRLAEQGVSPAVVQKISGHKTLAMVMKYTHVRDPAVTEAMRVLNGADYTEITHRPSGLPPARHRTRVKLR
ncbi:tyrosine-type recombinase/integrase [Novosphingobium subterraneum]|uniref:tyrosine-type recombinase/integrase n=1 Tax=Novosphingobium subterraneum TaxID=48936 RepID=UPI003D086184